MPIPNYSTRLALILAILFMGTMTGCVPWARGIRTLDESVTDWRDFVWGKRAYYQRYGHSQSAPFRDGFLEGYHDILQGGDGCLPVVPPRRYWNWRYQSAGGQTAVSDWFSGFNEGVFAAREDGLENLSSVPLSSFYNGMSTVPIEAAPVEEGSWPPGIDHSNGPVEGISPSVEQAPETNQTGALLPGGSEKLNRQATLRNAILFGEPTGFENIDRFTVDRTAVRPASALQPIGENSSMEMESLPLGNGTIQVSSMMGSIPASKTTSTRRGQETPLAVRAMPTMVSPRPQPTTNPTTAHSTHAIGTLPTQR